MKNNQLTKGQKRRVMYVENKNGDIDGAASRIGWVTFSKTGLSVYYRGRTLQRASGGGVAGNYFDFENRDEYWVSGIKKRGSNKHRAEPGIGVQIDDDALEEYQKIKN